MTPRANIQPVCCDDLPVYASPTDQELRLVEESGLFDEAWYRRCYLLGRTATMPPLVHFLRYGPRKGYRPNEFFDPLLYLSAFPDALASGRNPLLHFLQHLDFLRMCMPLCLALTITMNSFLRLSIFSV